MKQKRLLLWLLLTGTSVHLCSQTVKLKTGFGNGGVQTIPVTSEYVSPVNLAVQSTGKTVVGITTSDDLGYIGGAYVYRLTQSGQTDSTFGTYDNRISISPGGLSRLAELVVQPDDKIVTLSRRTGHFDYPNDTIFLCRFLPDSQPDSSFGTNGVVKFHKAYANMYGRYLTLKPNGKIDATITIDGVYYTIQLTADGKLDSSFGSGGRLTAQTAYDGNLRGTLALPDNRLAVAGLYTKPDNTTGSCVVVYKPSGRVDSAVGTNGVIVNNNTVTAYSFSIGLTVQPNNKLLVYTEDNENDVLLRYLPNGTPDAAFGTGGRVPVSSTFTDYTANLTRQAEVQANGNIVVNTSSDSALKRYLPNGAPDAAFGTAGTLNVSATAGGTYFALFGNSIVTMGSRYVIEDETDIRIAAYVPAGNAAIVSSVAPGTLPVLQSEDGARVYPNPAQDYITVSLPAGGEVVTVSLLSGAGAKLSTLTTRDAVCRFPVRRLPAGVYYVRVQRGTALPAIYWVVKQ